MKGWFMHKKIQYVCLQVTFISTVFLIIVISTFSNEGATFMNKTCDEIFLFTLKCGEWLVSCENKACLQFFDLIFLSAMAIFPWLSCCLDHATESCRRKAWVKRGLTNPRKKQFNLYQNQNTHKGTRRWMATDRRYPNSICTLAKTTLAN